LDFNKFIPFQIAKLQDDNRALDRLTKSKEAALLEAERTIEVALAKASLVDDLQNKNQELIKQIEICQVIARNYLWFKFCFSQVQFWCHIYDLGEPR
jgi:Microtubule-associated protein 70